MQNFIASLEIVVLGGLGGTILPVDTASQTLLALFQKESETRLVSLYLYVGTSCIGEGGDFPLISASSVVWGCSSFCCVPLVPASVWNNLIGVKDLCTGSCLEQQTQE